MISTKKHQRLVSLVFFMGSPFLAIPFVLRLVYHKAKVGLFLIAILAGIVGYMYIPHILNDKASYFIDYVRITNYDFERFIDNIFSTPNILFVFLLSVFSKFGISFQFFYFLLTFFVVGSFLYLFQRLIDKNQLSKKEYFACFLLLLFSFSLPNLLSGTKFYFGAALLLISLYNGILSKKHLLGIGFLLLACLAHFSLIVFVPAYFLLMFFPEKNGLFRVGFILSFAFLFLPKSFVYDLTQIMGLSESYSSKVDIYMLETDFVQKKLERGAFSSSGVVYFVSTMWVYAAYAYLIFKNKIKSNMRNIAYLIFAIINVFYVVPFVFSRYLVLGAGVLAFLLMKEVSGRKTKRYIFVFIGLFVVNWLVDIITLRYNITKSFFDFSSITSLTIFIRDKMTYVDFIR